MTKLFGSNGIRGVINEDMTTELASGIGKAWGTYLIDHDGIKRPHIAIATDARLSNHMIKTALISGLLSTGCDATDCDILPTPALQYAVKADDGYDAGIIITASHNPPQFNGIKGVDLTGTELDKETEEELEKIYFSEEYHLATWDDIGHLSTWDGGVAQYIQAILGRIDTEAIRERRYKVVLDCGSGAGSLATPRLLRELGCEVVELYCEPDGHFPGHESEPIPENLTELIKTVPKTRSDLGVAQDGDADRAIFVDENGTYLWGDTTISIVLDHITKENPGSKVATPVTTGSCFDDVAKKNKCTVLHTRVGSPIVAHAMIEEDCLFGGEGNGGLIFPEMQYTRDSAMTIAKILEIMATNDKRLSELAEVVPFYALTKTKIACPNRLKTTVMKMVITEVKTDPKIRSVDDTDGVKLYLHAGGWILIRPSGTEPIFRVFSESPDCATSENNAKIYKDMTEAIIRKLS